MIKIEGTIPQIEFELPGGAKQIVQMTGHKVAAFWLAIRKMLGWHKRPIKDIVAEMQERAKSGEMSLEFDEVQAMEAADLLLPPELAGQLTYSQYMAFIDEAVNITIANVFAPVEEGKKKEMSSQQ